MGETPNCEAYFNLQQNEVKALGYVRGEGVMEASCTLSTIILQEYLVG